MDLLTLQPRSTQLLSAPLTRPSSKAFDNNNLIHTLEQYMRSFLPDVRLTKHRFAKRQSTGANNKNSDKLFHQESPSATSVPTLSAAGKDPEVVFYSAVAPEQIIVYR